MRRNTCIVAAVVLLATSVLGLSACKRDGFITDSNSMTEAWVTACRQNRSAAQAQVYLKNTGATANHFIVTLVARNGARVVITMQNQTQRKVAQNDGALVDFHDTGLPQRKLKKLNCKITNIYRLPN